MAENLNKAKKIRLVCAAVENKKVYFRHVFKIQMDYGTVS
jgi:hypothetical protein